MLPTVSTYGNYSSANYGAHALRFDTPRGSVWFSYHTPVAFRVNGAIVCRQNDWGPTTGKHLNWIEPNKAKRISGAEFERQLAAAFQN